MSDTPDPNLDPQFDPDELRQMEAAMRNIPRLQREIFMAHRLDDMPYSEIARRTGLTKRQVEHHIAKALAKLVKQMNGYKLSWWERWF